MGDTFNFKINRLLILSVILVYHTLSYIVIWMNFGTELLRVSSYAFQSLLLSDGKKNTFVFKILRRRRTVKKLREVKKFGFLEIQ